jgi:hypothetical protein
MTQPIPLVTPPGKVILPASERAVVIELPIDNADVSRKAMYRSIFHRQPLVNGYSGHEPPHYKVLMQSLARRDVSGLLYFARLRPLVIMVNDVLDPGRVYRTMVEGIPGIEAQRVTSGGSMFLLPAQPEPRMPPVGASLRARVRDAGRYLLEFDIGSPQLLASIEFPLRRRYEDFAQRLRIETSEDGKTWDEAWVGWTGGLAVEGTLADPVLAPIRIPIPGARARYVRVYPASTWMKEELVVRQAE